MINDFGKEDQSFITENDLRNMLKCHFRGITKLVKLIYCNPNVKSNNNVNYIKNNEKELEIIENGKIRIINKEYVIDSIILDMWAILNNYYEKLEEDNTLEEFKSSLICNETWERITEFIDTYHKFKEGEDIDIEEIRHDIFIIIKIYTNEKKKHRRKSTKY